MKSPQISVIVPVYNVEKYLPRCIDSILTQSFADFELLLIDDGSKDNSGAICDKYANKDSRIRYLPFSGLSENLSALSWRFLERCSPAEPIAMLYSE